MADKQTSEMDLSEEPRELPKLKFHRDPDGNITICKVADMAPPNGPTNGKHLSS